MNEGQANDTSLWNITQHNKYLKRITVHGEEGIWAAYCQNGSYLYLGNIDSQSLV